MKIETLDPNEFRFGNHGWDIPFKIFTGLYKDFAEFLTTQPIVGKQKYPSFKQRDGCHAVMFEDDDGQWWTHIPDAVIEILEAQ